MRDEAENQSSINSKTTKKKTDEKFEFCKVCRLNHDQGRRHKYFPNHVKSLSSFLSRFQQKLSDVKFFLKNPTPLRPEHAARNRLWCAFCDSDFDEVDTSFACGNAINHLASADHLKNLKNFLWKHGGGMDQVDSFRISEADLAKAGLHRIKIIFLLLYILLSSSSSSSTASKCRSIRRRVAAVSPPIPPCENKFYVKLPCVDFVWSGINSF